MAKISVFLPDLRAGGAERLHIALAKEWLSLGVGVDFVLRQSRGDLLSALPLEAKVVGLGAARVRDAVVPLKRYLQNSMPDALLAAMWPLTVVAPLAAQMAQYRGTVGISEHSPLSIAYRDKGWLTNVALRLTTRVGYRLSDARIGVSSGVADDMARLAGLPRERVTVVHNPAALGVEVGKPPRPLGFSEVVRPLILGVGSLKPVKRYDLMIDAFALLPDSLGATLCIIGEGSERGALEQQISSMGLAGRVLLPGFVVDPAPWYAHADLFVLSSDYEGFGNVIVEAMEHGVPVVCTDCPAGPSEILVGGRYGRLVPPNDALALAAAMEESLAQSNDGDDLKARVKDFAVEKIARRYLEILLPTRMEVT